MSAAIENRRRIAVDYLAREWPVIPVAGKAALVKWGPFQHRLPTQEELETWPWDRATGVAIVIGPGLWQHHPFLWV